MRKRFAPLALLFGLLTAMLLASTSMAQANTIYPNFVCTNDLGVGVVTCIDSVNNITRLLHFWLESGRRWVSAAGGGADGVSCGS